MKKPLVWIIVVGLIFISAILIWRRISSRRQVMNEQNSTLKITSPAFAQNSQIPQKYTCKGENISPPLNITGVPEGAKSLVLILHDPDAPNGDFTHWLVWNIPSNTATINENSAPSGAIEGTNGAGKTGYMGPCPPSGTHHYLFEIYALDYEIQAPNTTDQPSLRNMLEGHLLSKDTLTGLFGH